MSDFNSPKDLLDAYKNGFVGSICDPEDLSNLLGELKTPLFGAAAYKLYGAGEGKLSLPFKSLLKFDPKFGPSERQTTGDCVSHSTRNAVDITRAVEIDIKGESESFETRSATEAIYQSRGHRGQGMSCAGAARYVNQVGGILLRKNYGDVDLSVYNSSLGANHRIPSSIYTTEAQKHQVKTISLVTTIQEARDALANGYAISVCSNFGFSSTRDRNGIAKRSGSWAHAMCYHPETEILTKKGWIFVKDINKDDVFCTLNPKTHEIEWQKTKDIFEFDFDGELYHFNRRSLDILVTPEHRMYGIKQCRYIENNIPENYEFITAEEVSQSFYIKNTCKNNYNAKVLTHKTNSGIEIDMDIWLEFLGYFLSEGCVVSFDSEINRKDRKNNPYVRKIRRVEISQTKEENLDIIEKCLSKLPFNFRRIKNAWVCEQQVLNEELSCFGKAWEKYIPDYVWDCGVDQLKILANALMLGDGSCKDNGDFLNYTTTSKRLADDFQKLMLFTGFSCKITENQPSSSSFGKRNVFNINIRLCHDHVSLGEPEKAQYVGKVYCPSTENGIVYVRRNGKPSWCGNCWIGVDDTKTRLKETLFLVQNSWGKWNSGPRVHGQPEGSFWIHEADARNMLAAQGSWVFSNVDGFPARDLPDYGTASYL